MHATLLQRDHDLAEMLRALHKAKSVGGLLEWEDAVDDRMQLVRCDGAVHVLEHGHRSDVNSMHAEGLKADQSHWYGTGHAGQHANDSYLAGRANTVHGTGERFAAAHFKNDVDTLAAGKAQHFFVPLGMCSIINGLVRTERFGSRQLLIAAGGDDHAGAVQLGELESENGHAAGAEEQHGIAGLYVRRRDQRIPGSEAGHGSVAPSAKLICSGM